ncbi:MAG: monovalent cation:proton antiporter-2 (CPA2) family protein [Pseudomonadota bacterium]|nr:monovalent cation:proton antiporter-2 (CPA2) family protein [Pseudomonadota bacterium]
MHETAAHGSLLLQALVFLAAAVVAVPLFRRFGLGTVLGYLAAGVVIGPAGLELFTDGERVMGIAELGVVFLLFVIGLELRPRRLWELRRNIFGLGAAQVVLTGLILMLLGWLADLPPAASLVAGFGLALSSTAFAMQILEERGELQSTAGRQAFSILLFQDLSIVPLLALIPLLSPYGGGNQGGVQAFLFAVLAIATVIVAGRYLLNPMFRVLALTNAREIMTAAALLVVLGAAALMTFAGLSMALGAFLAGILLAESNYRHELEADIEPFRGLLLALFFISIGIAVDWRQVVENWPLMLVAVPTLMVVKAGLIYALLRAFGGGRNVALETAGVLPQGGEFGFVLFAAASAAGIMSRQTSSLLMACVSLSMALTPLAVGIAGRLQSRSEGPEPDEDFSDARGTVLVIGFGRFGQIVSQLLLTRGIAVTIIDNDVEMIDTAGRFGFRIYYGDGTRLDVLRAAGAERARLICICVDKRDAANRIVDIVREQFPDTLLYVRSFDRTHSLELVRKGVDYEMRETYESAMLFGKHALMGLGLSEELATAVEEDVRRRDAERLARQKAEGVYAGAETLRVRPEPIVQPRRPSERLNPQEVEAAAQAERETDPGATV